LNCYYYDFSSEGYVIYLKGANYRLSIVDSKLSNIILSTVSTPIFIEEAISFIFQRVCIFSSKGNNNGGYGTGGSSQSYTLPVSEMNHTIEVQI
jgi:hypothetical protein